MKRENKVLTLNCEFNNSKYTENVISKMTDYLSSVILDKDEIYVDVQSFPNRGYKLTITINFYVTALHRRNYTKDLANLADWLCNDDRYNGCLMSYQYRQTTL